MKKILVPTLKNVYSGHCFLGVQAGTTGMTGQDESHHIYRRDGVKTVFSLTNKGGVNSYLRVNGELMSFDKIELVVTGHHEMDALTQALKFASDSLYSIRKTMGEPDVDEYTFVTDDSAESEILTLME